MQIKYHGLEPDEVTEVKWLKHFTIRAKKNKIKIKKINKRQEKAKVVRNFDRRGSSITGGI